MTRSDDTRSEPRSDIRAPTVPMSTGPSADAPTGTHDVHSTRPLETDRTRPLAAGPARSVPPGPPPGPPPKPAWGPPSAAPVHGRYPVHDPAAPYGRDPQGVPYSGRSRVAAGILQIALGGLPIGRLYLGCVGIGVTQLALTMAPWIIGVAVSLVGVGRDGTSTTATALTLILMAALYVAGVTWVFADGIVILVGRARDGDGRPLPP